MKPAPRPPPVSQEPRPRLSVVVPLLLVCFGTIGYLIQDLFNRPAPETSVAARDDLSESKELEQAPPRPRGFITTTRFSRRPLAAANSDSEANTFPAAEVLESSPDLNADSRAPVAAPLRSAIPAALVQKPNFTEITGKITLRGTPPFDPTIDAINQRIKSDPFCGKLDLPPQKSRIYVVGANGELADVVVFVSEGLHARSFTPPHSGTRVTQSGCSYMPYLSALQTRQRLLVKNADLSFHNVSIRPSPDSGNRPSNQSQAASGPDWEFTFDRPELFIRLECSVHPWMVGYVSVFDHPYFAISDKEGAFTIANLPPGEYVIDAVHRKAGRTSAKAKVQAHQRTTLHFILEVPAPETGG